MVVSIIGAGLGGLTLGCALKARGIPCTIFERSRPGPRNGYSITLFEKQVLGLDKPDLQSLPSLLGIDRAAFRSAVAVDGGLGGAGRLDESTIDSYSKDDEHARPFRAHRATVESLLGRNLDIRWDAKLADVRSIAGQKTELVFENGSNVVSDYVVAADGVHSNVRKALLPDLDPTVLPFVVFNGKRRMSKEVYDRVYAPAMSGVTTLDMLTGGNVRLQLALNEVKGDRIGLSYTYSRPARAGDTLHRPDRSVNDATNIPEEFYKEVSQLKSLPPAFSEAFNVENMKDDRLLHWLMRVSHVAEAAANSMSERLSQLAVQGIYFMGDAIHSQPILGGYGGNIAIQDALQLAEELDHRIKRQDTFDSQPALQQAMDFYSRRIALWLESTKNVINNIYKLHDQSGPGAEDMKTLASKSESSSSSRTKI